MRCFQPVQPICLPTTFGEMHKHFCFILRQWHANARMFLCAFNKLYPSTFKQILKSKRNTEAFNALCTWCVHLFFELQSTLRYTTTRRCCLTLGNDAEGSKIFLPFFFNTRRHSIYRNVQPLSSVTPCLPVYYPVPPQRLISRVHLASATLALRRQRDAA